MVLLAARKQAAIPSDLSSIFFNGFSFIFGDDAVARQRCPGLWLWRPAPGALHALHPPTFWFE
jgi:hypothetical protein